MRAFCGRILIADDETAVIEVIGRLMKRLGYQVVIARDGAQVLDAVQSDAPDVILLDVNMPHVDGLKVCRQLKNSLATRLVPIILMTGLNATEYRLRGIRAGADDFLSKPLDAEELEARVDSLLRLKR